MKGGVSFNQDTNIEILYMCQLNFFYLFFRTIDTASLEFGAAPEAVNQVQPALRLKVANIVSTPTNGKAAL